MSRGFCPVTITLGAGFIKFHQLFERSLVMGGGGALHLRLMFCKIVCHD